MMSISTEIADGYTQSGCSEICPHRRTVRTLDKIKSMIGNEQNERKCYC